MTTADDVLRAITDLTEAHHHAPTWRELARYLHYEGDGTSAVDYWLQRLRDQGRVEWEDGKARTLRVVEPLTASPERA